VKHVFVETNFLVEIARPFPDADAQRLLARRDAGELRLHTPWCSVAEARRTLDRIIGEDLGFTREMIRFAVREHLADPTRFDKREIDKLKALADAAREAAIRTKDARLDAFVAGMEVIEPSRAVIAKTLDLFDTKSLKPFDEMALGAILARAAELHAAGEHELFFCTLDKKDLGPSDGRPRLRDAYAACGLAFRSRFVL
jgi:predicted nucleic acid-binding protein